MTFFNWLTNIELESNQLKYINTFLLINCNKEAKYFDQMTTVAKENIRIVATVSELFYKLENKAVFYVLGRNCNSVGGQLWAWNKVDLCSVDINILQQNKARRIEFFFLLNIAIRSL